MRMVKHGTMKMFSAPSSSKVGLPAASGSSEAPELIVPRWKRTIDILCCLAALPALVVCAFFATVLTTLASPGPIFFKQERVGLRGRRFNLYKFRTMHVSADTASHAAHFASLVRSKGPMQKLDGRGDSRLIPGGWLLRASGLDELPQIINVLRGEMSLVGPRPCIPYEYTQYSAEQRERFSVVPGLTGLWQVSGKNRTTFDEMIQLDVRYARSRSLALDLKIMLRTLPALLTQISDTRKAKSAVKVRKDADNQNRVRISGETLAKGAMDSSVATVAAR
jgi:exopolysaccharide production protein ExoY